MKTIIYFILLFSALSLHAQEDIARMEVVGKPRLDEVEIVARKLPDGRFCAAIKIFSDLEGFSYDAYLGVKKLDDLPGQDIVFLDPKERALLVYHTAYPTLTIVLSETGIHLEQKQIWEIRIKGGKVDVLPMSFVVEPKEASLFFKQSWCVFAAVVLTWGDTFNEGDNDEKPVHRATVDDFYLSKYEVTFSEYNALCEATGREHHSDYGYGAGLRAMNFISWYDAVEYCNWRSEQEGLALCYKIDKTRKDANNLNKDDDLKWVVSCDFTANGYRLPTEAEWEYAARERGKKVRFGNGQDIADPEEINFCGLDVSGYKQPYSVVGVYLGKTTDVGSFASNALDLYDMSGNVWEWCWDWGAGYSSMAQDDPRGPDSGQYRVLRAVPGSVDQGSYALQTGTTIYRICVMAISVFV